MKVEFLLDKDFVKFISGGDQTKGRAFIRGFAREAAKYLGGKINGLDEFAFSVTTEKRPVMKDIDRLLREGVQIDPEKGFVRDVVCNGKTLFGVRLTKKIAENPKPVNRARQFGENISVSPELFLPDAAFVDLGDFGQDDHPEQKASDEHKADGGKNATQKALDDIDAMFFSPVRRGKDLDSGSDDDEDPIDESLFDDDEDGDEDEDGEASEKRVPRFPDLMELFSQPEEDQRKTAREQKIEAYDLPTVMGKITEMREKLCEKVKGQEHAIEVLLNGMFSILSDKKAGEEDRPRGVFLFAGPPGVGKTFLAESVAKVLDLPFKRLNMSDYSDREIGVQKFAGMQPSYKSAEAGVATKFADDNPVSIMLFDEVEKASIDVIHLFLQILDAGVCRDAYTGEDVSFRKVIIIITTNAGRTLYEDAGRVDLSGYSDKQILQALVNDVDPHSQRAAFPAAIVSRLSQGSVVMFNHLDAYSLSLIASKELRKNVDELAERYSLQIEADPCLPLALLYSKGGATDARTIKGTAKSFVSGEVLSLFNKLIKNNPDCLSGLKKIKIDIDLDGAEEEAADLFKVASNPRVLVFTDKKNSALLQADGCKLLCVSDTEKAKNLLRGDIIFAVIDPMCGVRAQSFSPLDLDDVNSEGMDLFRYIRECHEELPVYVFAGESSEGKDFRTLLSRGARGVIEAGEKSGGQLNTAVEASLTDRACSNLSRSCKALFYNCAQILNGDGEEAEIKLAFLSLKRNIYGDDAETVLNTASRPRVKFADVIGAHDAKETLKEFSEFLKNPRAYYDNGARMPRGVLLYGPPGTGKTLLAKAMAGESDVAFIEKNATDFFNKYVGEGPRAVREAFRIARKYAPSVLFIDEVDAFGKTRTGGDMNHSAEEILNVFLSEMDGFSIDETRPVFVLAATNYEIDESSGVRRLLDPAFVRRFDRKIRIELPDAAERREFIEYYLAKHGIGNIGNDTIENLAVRSIGRSPADLEMIIEYAIRMMKGKPLDDKTLTDALDAEKFGEEKSWSEETVLMTTRHETGHALVSWITGSCPAFVTNISRGSFGGYMMHDSDESKFGYNRRELIDRICTALAGRAAELLYYGEEDGMTTGPSGDLQQATRLAWSLISHYGMLGELMTMPDEMLYSGSGQALRQKVNEILNEQLERAKTIISQNKPAFEALTDELLKKNSLTGKEVDDILSRFTKKSTKM